ncbi:piezo-type mechanosensitive ion channel component 2-like protein [Labeo rohita]|uniref:Piezo-type mechanosensitive ion channel component 2-like protein n=1 Tax=Labeo rohita TaxID=84645 RepID=A0A498M6P0_LABRO|nr:piezo-type mechanosensitive ion channel component 2-like protein [Labeo rohita]
MLDATTSYRPVVPGSQQHPLVLPITQSCPPERSVPDAGEFPPPPTPQDLRKLLASSAMPLAAHRQSAPAYPSIPASLPQSEPRVRPVIPPSETVYRGPPPLVTDLQSRISEQRKRIIVHGTQWICDFRFALNSAWHESTGYSPAEIALGRKLIGPLERALQNPPDPDQPSYDAVDRQSQLFDLSLSSPSSTVLSIMKRMCHYNLRDLIWAVKGLSMVNQGQTLYS